MKPSSYRCVGHEKLTSAGTTSTVTALGNAKTSGVEITVETNAARFTFDGTDPQTGVGLIIQANQNPWFLPLGPDSPIRAVSTVSSAIIQLAYLS